MQRSFRLAVTFLAIGAMLEGCSAPQSSFSAAPQIRPGNETKSRSPGGDLLYVVNYGRTAAFLTFPEGKQIGEISGIGHANNVCSDASGNVWFTSSLGRNRYKLYEFAHGGTQPIASIDVPKSDSAVGCAINPTNGDLAVLNNYGGSSYDSVLIWAGGQSGTPKEYRVFFVPTACAYDKRGNLLVTGWADSDGYFLAELKIGAAKFTNISLKPHPFLAGSLRWDGRYFAVAVQHGRGSLIYRLHVMGSMAKVVQTVEAKPLIYQTWFWAKGATMIATKRSHDTRLLGIWKYPLGGTPLKSFPGLTRPLGLTVSVGS